MAARQRGAAAAARGTRKHGGRGVNFAARHGKRGRLRPTGAPASMAAGEPPSSQPRQRHAGVAGGRGRAETRRGPERRGLPELRLAAPRRRHLSYLQGPGSWPGSGTGPTYSWGPADGPSGWPADDAETAHHWAQHMSTGGKAYVVTEYPPGGGPGRTVATYVNGKPSTEGVSSMPASPSRIKTEHRAQRAAARSGGRVPSEWGPVIAQTADFEPEDDGELLEWMGRQVTGLSAWAEALVDFYDHATNTIGIDPQASAMLHDVADAAAQAAETMGAAKAKFTEHYELPREFAGNGGLMTHDGRWITGEGA